MTKNYAHGMFRRIAGFAAFAFIATALIAAAPAHASSPKISISFGGGHGVFVKHDHHHKSPPRHSREFERGFEAGQRDGFEEGFKDGLRNKRFCDDDGRIKCHGSHQFRLGFEAGYARAYRAGYEKGQCERRERICKNRCCNERECRNDFKFKIQIRKGC